MATSGYRYCAAGKSGDKKESRACDAPSASPQEEFAARHHIPLRHAARWEQGRTEPDQPARAYLTVIARDPEGVLRALQAPIPQGEERNRAGGGLKNGSFVRQKLNGGESRDDGYKFVEHCFSDCVNWIIDIEPKSDLKA